MRCAVAHKANWAKPRGSGGGPWGFNLFGSHSPPLAARLARVSEPDVWLTAGRERLTVSSPNTPPLGAGILYNARAHHASPFRCGRGRPQFHGASARPARPARKITLGFSVPKLL